jgi:hypothetical protein
VPHHDRLGTREKELVVGRVGQSCSSGKLLGQPFPIAAERIGLCRPVEVAKRPGEALEVMFGGVVIREGEQAATPQVDNRAIRRSISAIA